VTLTLIAAVGANNVIGRDNALPWQLPEDLRHFKRVTLGHTLIMGRRTFESIGRPLPGRQTIVLSTQPGWSAEGARVCRSLPDALAAAAGIVFIAGGAEVYRQALPGARRILLTRVDQSPTGDAFFPELEPAEWTEAEREQRDGYAFVTLVRR
jgi:dihydrofolate reductase